jgi:hypothetical protein
MTTKYFDKLLAEISKTGNPNLEDSEYISRVFYTNKFGKKFNFRRTR